MAQKRPADTANAEADNKAVTAKKRKTGFSVGPQNLPDGTHRRKGALRTRDVWGWPFRITDTEQFRRSRGT